MSRAGAWEPRLRLLLAGPVGDAPRLEALLDRHGLKGRAVVTGRVPLADLATHIEAADVVAHLRVQPWVDPGSHVPYDALFLLFTDCGHYAHSR